MFVVNKNKKVYQSNANCLLADSMGFIVNKFEHVWSWGPVQRKAPGLGSGE